MRIIGETRMICEITECQEQIMPGVPWCPEHASEAEGLGIIKKQEEMLKRLDLPRDTQEEAE